MQQHLMQMQPMMAAYYSNSNVTTDHIQQYLDENKSLILKIVESQNSGKLSECAENQARLQRNLMYLAAIADSQPQPPSMHSQYPQNGNMQPAGHYMQQQQQAQSMTPQAMMAARSSSMLYNQQPYMALQQTQPMHGQFSISSGSSSGLTMLQADHNNTSAGGSPYNLHDFGRGTSGDAGMLGIGRALGKQDIASSSSSDGRGHDGSESLYLKSTDDGN